MRLLSCWEMGSGLGHIDRMLVCGRALRERGHEVEFALRDLSRAHQRVIAEGFQVLQSPVWLPRMAGPPRLGNFSAVLAAAGWLDPAGLAGLVRGWQRLFELVRPDAISVDHAPTALLAARLCGLPAVAIGNSFEVPPQADVFPPMAWWNPEMAAHCANHDRQVLELLNRALALLGHAPWQRLTQLFDGVPRAVLQDPRLSHYPSYDDEAFFAGPVYRGDSGALPLWPEGGGTKVFGYLAAGHSAFEPLMRTLLAENCRVLLYAKNLSAEQSRRLQHPRLRLESQPLHIDQVMLEADLVLSHASLGTVTAAALAGKPQLGLPNHMEQLMVGRRLSDAGIGLSCGLEPKPDEAPALLKRLLREPGFGVQARDMAASNPLRPADTGRRVATWLEQALASASSATAESRRDV